MNDFINNAWFLAPVCALILGIIALAPLGVQVLARGVVFIDLAVAQAAAAAALWAGSLVEHEDFYSTQALAIAGALVCVGIVAWISKRWPAQREALIGLLYVLGASVALLGARQDPHGRERMSELLAADILWAHWHHVGTLAVCAVLITLLSRHFHRDRVFYPCFAIVASLAVPVLGLFLVFATLIAPALWQRSGLSTLTACAGAACASLLGLAASWYFDLPSGACVALFLGTYGVSSAFMPRKPLLKS